MLTLLILSSCVDKDKWRCQTYTDYLNIDQYGRLEKKYIDKENHARQTLLLVNRRTEKIEIDIPYIVKGLYDTLQIGDELIKEKGSDTTIVKRGKTEIKLTVDKTAWCKDR
jgi:CRISPR/Cas system Type II protein with McrA/HNH and RuvC-like nuclease domain